MIGLGAYVGLLVVVPVRMLPVIALLTTLLIPTSSSLLPPSVQDAAIGVVPLAVWFARERPRPRRSASSYVIGIGFMGWLAIGELAAAAAYAARGRMAARSWRSDLWGLSPPAADAGAVTCQKMVHACRDCCRVLRGRRRICPTPQHRIRVPLQRHRVVEQHASVSYRVTTIFGHPLVNGLIFAVAGTFAAAECLRRRDRPAIGIIRLALLVGAVLATHSRGPAVGLGVGVILVLVFVPSQGYGKGARRAVLSAGAVLAAVVILSGLQARNTSVFQGEQSVALRSTVVAEAFQAVRMVEPFGAGPGESEPYRVAQALPGTGASGAYRPLENSYAELLVSLSPVGLALFCAALLVPACDALRRRRHAEEAAALFALLTVIAGFNAIEGFPSVLVLISLLLVSVMQPESGATIPSRRPPPASSGRGLAAHAPVPQHPRGRRASTGQWPAACLKMGLHRPRPSLSQRTN